jgi:hypothetical protein
MKNCCLFLFAAVACAQQLDLTSLDKLASKASESNTITLDGAKLGFASQFLSGDDPSQAKARDLVKGLKGIFVRTFEFDRDNQFTQSDFEPVRKQLNAPGWSNIVSVKERNESAEVWLFSQNDQLGGIAILAIEPNEIAVVNIVGPIDINTLAALSGSFGIPRFEPRWLGEQKKRKPQAEHPKKEKDDDEED